jgi:hypothetical protein
LVGCISGRSAASHRKVVGFKSEIPGRLNLGAERLVPAAYKKPSSRRVIALAQDSFDRGKAR